MKVVELGPKLAKKKVSAYMVMKSHTLMFTICVYAEARMIRMIVIMTKPCEHTHFVGHCHVTHDHLG